MNFSRSIVFITGTFLGNNCWDEWQSFFEGKGYKCIAPAWPNKDASPEALRNQYPYNGIASNTLLIITDHYAGIISTLPFKPILIGHSLGGLIVQLLTQRGLATAAVAIHSFPPQGISGFKFSFLKTSWEANVFFTGTGRSYLMSFRKWCRSISNGMTCAQQKEFYYKYATPESKLIIRDILRCNTKINFEGSRVPLLLTSGGKDRLIPAAVNYLNYKHYSQSDSLISYKEFKDQNHLIFGQPAWIEEADFILYWLQGINK